MFYYCFMTKMTKNKNRDENNEIKKHVIFIYFILKVQKLTIKMI